MRKKVLLIFLAFCLVFILVLLIFIFGRGTRNYRSKVSNISLEIPRFTIVNKESGAFIINMYSIRTLESLQEEIAKMLNSYETIRCGSGGMEYYYNKDLDYTVTEYGIEKGIIKKIYFIYDVGNVCDTEEFNNNDLLIRIEEAKNKEIKQLIFPEVSSYVKPLNYKLYSYGLEKIIITVEDKEYALEEALRQNKVTIENIVKFLENGALYGNWQKNNYDDGGSIMYKNFEFAFLKCNTLAGNKDYYIGNIDMQYEENFCK